MFMLLITVAVAGVTAYIWSTRGFFSSLVHMVCVLAAGAIAFGVWEPVSYLILDQSGDRGFGSMLSGVAWGLGLAVPFALSLALLRAGVDKLLPFNAQCETSVDYIGGAVCGLVSGVISAGIVVLSIGYLRLEPDFGGYKPVVFTSQSGRGSLQENPDSFVPWVDRLTARLYSGLSLTTLRTGEPLAKWHPDLETENGALRTTYEGKSRNAYKPDSFVFQGWYTVGNTSGNQTIESLMPDAWDETPQKIADLRGEPFGQGYIAGFNIKFKSAAKEKTGQVVIGNGQIRLVVQKGDEEDYRALHPMALITNIEDPTKVEYARFRYNSDDVYIASVGGASEANMAFEFPIPAGYHPIALYVKGARVELEGATEPKKYDSAADRDAVIQAGDMTGMGGVGPILGPDGQPVAAPPTTAFGGPFIQANNNIGVIIQRGTEQGVEVAEEGRGWTIRNGEMRLKIDQLKGRSAGVEPKLQVNRFSVNESTVVVQVDVSPSHRPDEFGKVYDLCDKDKPPVLVDTNGVKYEAVGFVYKDLSDFMLRYTVGAPLKGLGEAGVPSVSRSTPNRELKLVFRVSLGVDIKEFRIGDRLLETYDPPLKCNTPQK